MLCGRGANRKAAILESQASTDLFVHRPDRWGRQQPDGTYLSIRQPVIEQVVRAHLAGQLTARWNQLGPDSTVIWACLDADANDGLAPVQRAAAYLSELGISDLCEGGANQGGPGGAGPLGWALREVEDVMIWPGRRPPQPGQLAPRSFKNAWLSPRWRRSLPVAKRAGRRCPAPGWGGSHAHSPRNGAAPASGARTWGRGCAR